MKIRRWMWITAGLVGAVLALILLAHVSGRSNQRREAQNPARAGSAFGPKEIWAASSPIGGLGEAFSLGSRARQSVVQKSVGIDLTEAPPPPPPPPSDLQTLKLIRNGWVELEVKSIDAATRAVTDLVKGLGGYVASSSVHQDPEGPREGSMVLRIPSARFDSAGSALEALGRVRSSRSEVLDVTRTYVDLETRLGVKRASAAKIRELLRTRAGSLKEVLEAEKELARLTEEIESTEAERRVLADQIRFSTFHLELKEPQPRLQVGPGAWASLVGTLRDSGGILADSLAILLRVVLVFAPWVGLGAGFWYGLRWYRRRKRDRAERA